MQRLVSVGMLAALLLGALASPSGVTAGSAARQAAPGTAAHAADGASIDSILSATYDVISGPAGKKRDWDRFRALFAPGARLIPTGPRKEGGVESRVVDVEGYIERSAKYLEGNGFYEREVARHTDSFGQIAQVFSTYESRHKADDATPFVRGINSFQLMNDGKRWWIVTIFWQGEGAGAEIPEKYLTGKN
jgi:hypothetical protein